VYIRNIISDDMNIPPLVASNSVMKPEYREGELYGRARDAYFEANY